MSMSLSPGRPIRDLIARFIVAAAIVFDGIPILKGFPVATGMLISFEILAVGVVCAIRRRFATAFASVAFALAVWSVTADMTGAYGVAVGFGTCATLAGIVAVKWPRGTT